MKTRKLLIALFLMLSMLFTFPACKMDDDDDEEDTQQTQSSSQTNTQNTSEQNSLKDLSVSVLIDGEKLTDGFTLENETAHTLSFALADSSGKTDGLPTVSATWQFESGGQYVSLSAKEGVSVSITNANYSASVQSVSIYLTINPASSYKTTSVTINLKTAILEKKDFSASILYDGESASENPTLASAGEVLLSYSADISDVSATWEIESGGEYAAGEDTDNGSLKISNLNCSASRQAVTVKLTLTPTNQAYNTASSSITFTVADSTADLQPGAFSATAELNRDTYGEDGTVKISWTKSQNAKNYIIYRDDKEIACITDALYYLDDFSNNISEIADNNYNVTYYVKAVNQSLEAKTSSIAFFVGGLIPSSKASNVYAIPQKDSDGYYGVNVTWESSDYYKFDVYRLVSYSASESAAAIMKNGTRVMQWASNYKYNNGKFEYSCWDYNIVDDVTSSSQYVHYTVVTKTTYSSSNNYIVLSSKPSAPYYAKCTLLVGKPNKYAGSSTADSAIGSSKNIIPINVKAEKCIMYNRYSYCKLYLPKKNGVSYKIYRCPRMSINFGSISPSDCSYIGTTNFYEYVDGGVCNEYFYENTSASGKYYWYMYYYVVGVDSSGNAYVSDIIKAE